MSECEHDNFMRIVWLFVFDCFILFYLTVILLIIIPTHCAVTHCCNAFGE